MTMVGRLLKWVRRIWRKMTGWVLSWKRKAKPYISRQPKKQPLKGVEKTSTDFDVKNLVKPRKESKVSDLNVCPGGLEPPVLATAKERPSVPPVVHRESETLEILQSHKSRSLMRLSQTVVHSVSMLMCSALQSGWRLCKWKSSVSSASVSSRLRTRTALETPEAEMLREVYLVLWVIRKQLRGLARRQERRRRRRVRSHASYISRPSDPVQGLKPDARSPL
ncbi:TSC22 domain family protein 4 isoform X2 [Peromyscus eremicus]|uniref:TSC22 domain family protein 4 isoform X2 n=1 Tax=Peromyscus eremicus TaxID=42410 RepID=UPI0027DAEE7F|nr:TSC22 domain family protein 4 isoform X2 [Peromyscus eremicus]